MGFSKSSAKGKVHRNTSPLQETRQTSNKQPNFTPKATRKRRNEELERQQKEEIIKIKAEVSEKETKKTIAKVIKTKSWFFGKINKIDKPFARRIRKKGRRLKSIKL